MNTVSHHGEKENNVPIVGTDPFTVTGTTTSPATNVTVNTSNAVLYADASFVSTNQLLVNNTSTNTYTAIAKDIYGRLATNTVDLFIPGIAKYTYDLNGNLLNEYGTITGTNRIFAYDDENQLTSVYVTNNWRSDFVYDGKLRRRIERDYAWQSSAWVQTNEIHFIYDDNVVIQERDINNLPKVTYTRGKDLSGSLQGAGGIGGLLARTDNSQLIIGSPSAHAYYHADCNGNITMLINSYQAIVAKYLYDPFGNTLSLSGSLANANTYRFSSKEWNDNAGLYYYLYRYYDPNLQRWPNRDPLGENGGMNLYGFVANAPINKHDSLGLEEDGIPQPIDPYLPPKPRPYDPSIPDDRADLRECFQKAQAYDNSVFKCSGDHISSTEFMKVVEDCMKEKGHIYPPPS